LAGLTGKDIEIVADLGREAIDDADSSHATCAEFELHLAQSVLRNGHSTPTAELTAVAQELIVDHGAAEIETEGGMEDSRAAVLGNREMQIVPAAESFTEGGKAIPCFGQYQRGAFGLPIRGLVAKLNRRYINAGFFSRWFKAVFLEYGEPRAGI